jgi:hypothetical protein
VVALVFWHFLLLKLRIETGVIWRKVYVLSYYLAILLLPKVVANSERENKEKPINKQEPPAEATSLPQQSSTLTARPNSDTYPQSRRQQGGALITRTQLNSFSFHVVEAPLPERSSICWRRRYH